MATPPLQARTIGAAAPMARRTSAVALAIAVLVSSPGTAAEQDAIARAVERGWWSAARRASRAAGSDVAAIDRLEAEAIAARSARMAWLRSPDSWTNRWSRPLSGMSLPKDGAGMLAPVLAARIAAWSTGHAVHAVSLAHGTAAWRAESTPDTTLFPRFTAPRSGPSHDVVVPRIASAGHLVFAVIDGGDDGQSLICLDCSPAAEGRLVWAVMPPAGMDRFDGPPVVDGDLCAIVARSAEGRPALELIALDARDGCLLWRQPLGTGVAGDGIDHGRGVRSPALCEDLVVIADHAGTVTAFHRSGGRAWGHRYDTKPRDTAPMVELQLRPEAIAAGRDTIAVAPFDRGGVIALDVGVAWNEPPAVRWETPTGMAARIVGATNDRIVIEADADPPLQSLSLSDGRMSATGAGVGSLLVGGLIVNASAKASGGVNLVVLDPATLRPVAEPFSLDGRHRETAVALAGNADALVIATHGMLSCIVPRRSATP